MPYSVFLTQSCCFGLFLEFLCKECPRVHIFIDRIELKDIPEEQLYMRRWLHERFEIKDKWVAICRTFCLKKLSYFLYINRYTHDFCASCRALWREVVLVLLCIFSITTLWLNLLLRRLGFLGFRPSLDWRAVSLCSRRDSYWAEYSPFIFLCIQIMCSQECKMPAVGKQAKSSLILAS